MPSAPKLPWELKPGTPRPAAGASRPSSQGQAPTDPSLRVSGPNAPTDPSTRVSGIGRQ
jgi:hypothetical protein